MRKIQILRGTFAKKPNLEDGQMYLAKDTKQVFVGDKAITEGEIEFANKSDLNNYLPLSGGEMVGPITLGDNPQLVKQTNAEGGTNVVSMTDRLFIARNTALPSDASNNAQVLIQTRNSVFAGDDPYSGVNMLGLKVEVKEKGMKEAGITNAEQLTFDLNGGLTTHVVDPSDERMPTPKSYVDNAISAISSVNIEVSETQPTNQKAGDFWYHVTGTV